MEKEKLNKIKRRIEEIESMTFPLKEKSLFAEKLENKNRLTLSDIENFERKYNLILPEEYKLFLSHISNGGYGVLPLKERPLKGESFLENNFEKLKFPFEKINWKELNKDTFEKAYNRGEIVLNPYVNIAEFRTNFYEENKEELDKQTRLFQDAHYYENEIFIERLYHEYYETMNHWNGTLVVEYDAQNSITLLVVSGKEKGKIYVDERWGSDYGIFPLIDAQGKTIGFLDWFEDLLEQEIKDLLH